jgi:hypothetical protein
MNDHPAPDTRRGEDSLNRAFSRLGCQDSRTEREQAKGDGKKVTADSLRLDHGSASQIVTWRRKTMASLSLLKRELQRWLALPGNRWPRAITCFLTEIGAP